MENFDEYDVKIAGYFDNKMSPGEEEAFMEELGTNTALRARFEEELQMQAFFYQQDNSAARQNTLPAGGYTVTGGVAPVAKKPAKILSLPFKTFMAVAASLLVIATGTVIYLLPPNGNKAGAGNPNAANLPVAQPNDTNKNNMQPGAAANQVTANNTHPRDTLYSKNIAASKHADTSGLNESGGEDTFGRKRRRNDSAAAATGPIADTGKAYQAFIKFYTIYQSNGDDPPAANATYQNYAHGKYSLVIEGTSMPAQTGLQASGTAKANNYLSLYKGLSYLSLNKPQDAISQFNGILSTCTKTQPLYYKAEWYKVLSLLKINYTFKAAQLAQSISKSLSPYKTQAAALLAAL